MKVRRDSKRSSQRRCTPGIRLQAMMTHTGLITLKRQLEQEREQPWAMSPSVPTAVTQPVSVELGNTDL